MHQKDVADFIQPYLDFQIQGTSSLYKTVQVFKTPGEIGSGILKFFRSQVDFKDEEPPAESFKDNNKDHLCFLMQGARATAFAVWFLTDHVTKRIGFNSYRNLTPYTRFILGFSDEDPAMSYLEDPFYVKLEEVELLEAHKRNLDTLEKLNRVNQADLEKESAWLQ